MRRIKYIDMAKGICILLILYCHIITSFNSLCKWASSFFVVCFVICSGITSQRRNISLKKNCKNILAPYYIWGAIGLLIQTMITVLHNTFQTKILYSNILKYILGTEMWNFPLWFLVAFFVGKMIYEAIQKYFGKKESFIIETITVLSCVAVGICLGQIGDAFWPFRLDTGLVFVLFFWIGKHLRTFMEVLYTSKTYIQLLLIFGMILISYITTFSNSIVSMSSSDYGNIVLFLLSSLSGSILVLVLCMILEKSKLVSSFLEWWGINSNFIMCSHVFVIYAISLLLQIIGIDINKFVLCVLGVWIVKKCYEICYTIIKK